MAYSAVLDTCVLYPAYLRDTLLRLALAGTYRPLWSMHILDELQDNVAYVAGPEKAERIVTLMRENFEDAEVTGYEPLIGAMTNHPKIATCSRQPCDRMLRRSSRSTSRTSPNRRPSPIPSTWYTPTSSSSINWAWRRES